MVRHPSVRHDEGLPALGERPRTCTGLRSPLQVGLDGQAVASDHGHDLPKSPVCSGNHRFQVGRVSP